MQNAQPERTYLIDSTAWPERARTDEISVIARSLREGFRLHHDTARGHRTGPRPGAGMKDYGKGRGAKHRIAKAQQKADWNAAISEGRVVNFGDAIRSYRTPQAALLACNTAKEDGIDAFIVPAELAQ